MIGNVYYGQNIEPHLCGYFSVTAPIICEVHMTEHFPFSSADHLLQQLVVVLYIFSLYSKIIHVCHC